MLAISLEVMGTLCMRNTIQNELWLFPAYALYGAAFSLFPFVLRDIPLPFAYALWSGMGTGCVSVLSIFLFGDKINWVNWLGLLSVIAGVVPFQIV